MLFLSAVAASAIQRPETKATLRSLARLPRVSAHFSLDFSADRGFEAFDISKDPTVMAVELREKIATSTDEKKYLDLAAVRHLASEFNSSRDFQRAADALRRRLDSEPGNARLKIDLASALHGLGRNSEAESLMREAIAAAPSSTNQIAFSVFLEARAWEIAAETSNWLVRKS